MYESSVAAVTNDHKLGVLKQHRLILLQFWKSGVQNESVFVLVFVF